MIENDENDNLEQKAADVSAEALDILASATHDIAPTLAINAPPSDPKPQQVADGATKRRGRGRPRETLDPIVLANLGDKLSVPRKIVDEKNDASISASGAADSPRPGGGIPPESTAAGKIFAGEAVGASEPSLKKIPEKNLQKVPVTRQNPLSPDALLRARLTSGMRDAKLRQLFELMVQNPELKMHEAMRVLNYSHNSSPGQIVKQKSWQLMVGTIVSDEEIKERERFLLFHEDPRWVNASLDRLHKIKGSFQHTQTNVNVNIDGEVRQMSDSKLYEIIEAEVVEGEIIDENEETN